MFEAQFLTPSAGLRRLGALCGFWWDAGTRRGESVIGYDGSVNADNPAAARFGRNWLVAYNRDDVEAASALQGFPA